MAPRNAFAKAREKNGGKGGVSDAPTKIVAPLPTHVIETSPVLTADQPAGVSSEDKGDVIDTSGVKAIGDRIVAGIGPLRGFVASATSGLLKRTNETKKRRMSKTPAKRTEGQPVRVTEEELGSAGLEWDKEAKDPIHEQGHDQSDRSDHEEHARQIEHVTFEDVVADVQPEQSEELSVDFDILDSVIAPVAEDEDTAGGVDFLAMVSNKDFLKNPADQFELGSHDLPEDALKMLQSGEAKRSTSQHDIPIDAVLITKPNGLLSIPDDVRQYVAIYDDGSCFVHHQRLDDPGVLEARQKARHYLEGGIQLKDSTAVEFSRLRHIYELAATKDVASHIDTTKNRQEFKKILKKAVEMGASDIHFRYRGNRFLVEAEVDGFLTEPIAEFPPEIAMSMFTCAFYFADQGDHIERPSIPQYQSVTDPENLPDGTVGLRFTFTPMAGKGRDLNIRFLYAHSSFAEKGLESLDFLPDQLDDLRYIQSVGQKLFTISGETGSGKSTSADLWCEDTSALNNHAININSVDDPVENMMPHINYISVRTGTSDSSADALKSAAKVALRNAPHIVKLGECRFREQAEVALEAAITGKIAITTIHTPSILNIPDRYKGMGIPAAEAYDPDRHLAWLGQALISGLCPHCNKRLEDSNLPSHRPLKKRFKNLFPELYGEFRIRGDGCEHCKRAFSKITGIKGRFLAAEIIVEPSLTFMKKLQKNIELGRQHWVEDGGVTMQLHAFQYLVKGQIGVEDFLRRVGKAEILAKDIEWREGNFNVN